MDENVLDQRSAGYSYFCEKFLLVGIPLWHTSSVSNTASHNTSANNGYVHEVFRSQY